MWISKPARQCFNCRHFLFKPDEIGETASLWVGQCRRYPPTVEPHPFKHRPMSVEVYDFPWVYSDMVCGEWKRA